MSSAIRLAAGATYYCRVMAYNAISNSPYSVVTSVVTHAVSGELPNIAHFEVPAGAAAAPATEAGAGDGDGGGATEAAITGPAGPWVAAGPAHRAGSTDAI